MSIPIQAIDYGWWAVTGLATLASALYSNPPPGFVVGRDVMEPVLGTAERCLATEYSTNLFCVAPLTYLHPWKTNAYSATNVEVYSGVFTNVFEWYIDRDLLTNNDIHLTSAIPWYVASNAVATTNLSPLVNGIVPLTAWGNYVVSTSLWERYELAWYLRKSLRTPQSSRLAYWYGEGACELIKILYRVVTNDPGPWGYPTPSAEYAYTNEYCYTNWGFTNAFEAQTSACERAYVAASGDYAFVSAGPYPSSSFKQTELLQNYYWAGLKPTAGYYETNLLVTNLDCVRPFSLSIIGGGATVSNIGGYYCLEFKNPGWTYVNVTNGGTGVVEVLLVAGGGGGGSGIGGGGGGGEVLYQADIVMDAAYNPYCINVAAGGLAGQTGYNSSVFYYGSPDYTVVSALGGGAGGSNSLSGNDGSSGGSGGGGSWTNGVGGAGTEAGGSGTNIPEFAMVGAAGGGGGAGEAGEDGVCPSGGTIQGGNGGDGEEVVNFFGITTNYAAGGGGNANGINSGAELAEGGDVVFTNGGYRYHVFSNLASTSITFLLDCTNADLLIVAGGGGGGGRDRGAHGGGGGAGGLILTNTSFVAGTYIITVGAGGAVGRAGEDSVLDTLTAVGGGYGATWGDDEHPANNDAGNGGSGGGVGNSWPPWYTHTFGTGIVGQGHNGGDTLDWGAYVTSHGCAGGGGAGSVGSNSFQGDPGDGGAGFECAGFACVGGSPAGWFAGGGGGSTRTNDHSAGGLGGGGAGGNSNVSTLAVAGSPGTGGGGGGGDDGNAGRPGAVGGSGIIALRYRVSYPWDYGSGGAGGGGDAHEGGGYAGLVNTGSGGGGGNTNGAAGAGGSGIVYIRYMPVTNIAMPSGVYYLSPGEQRFDSTGGICRTYITTNENGTWRAILNTDSEVYHVTKDTGTWKPSWRKSDGLWTNPTGAYADVYSASNELATGYLTAEYIPGEVATNWAEFEESKYTSYLTKYGSNYDVYMHTGIAHMVEGMFMYPKTPIGGDVNYFNPQADAMLPVVLLENSWCFVGANSNAWSWSRSNAVTVGGDLSEPPVHATNYVPAYNENLSTEEGFRVPDDPVAVGDWQFKYCTNKYW